MSPMSSRGKGVLAVGIEACLSGPGASHSVPVMRDARWVLQDLAGRFEIIFVTPATERVPSIHDRYPSLQDAFPFVPPRSYVVRGSDHFVEADYLIDDNPRNLEIFAGHGILFTAHHNVSEDRFDRVYSWRDAHRYLAAVI
jgi:5'-nucleotidase